MYLFVKKILEMGQILVVVIL